MSTSKIQRLALVVLPTIGTLILFVALMGLGSKPAAAAPLAESCVTYEGKPLCATDSNVLANNVFALRSVHAQAPMTMTVEDSGDLAPLAVVNDPSQFGVVEWHGDMFVLLETLYKTSKLNNRYNAVVPPEGDHGDWPPHGILQTWLGTCNPEQLTAEISFRYVVNVKGACTLVYRFTLNKEHMDEYTVMASGGRLGLFVKSVTGVEVNGELIQGMSCHDCLNHTQIVTRTNTNIYTANELRFIGDSKVSDPLQQVYILPIEPNNAEIVYTVELKFTKPGLAYVWFGRADVPSAK